MSLRLILSLPVLLWAVTANAPRNFRLYFLAQLIDTALLELTYGRVPTAQYELVYFFGLLLLLVTMGMLVASTIDSWKPLPFALIVTAFVGGLAFGAIKQWNEPIVIVAIEGLLFVFTGTVLAFRVPFLSRRKAYAALVIYWYCLALFDFAFAMDVTRMSRMNVWLPTTAMIVTMGYLGKRFRDGNDRIRRPA